MNWNTIRQKLEVLLERITIRFSEACESFSARLDWEKSIIFEKNEQNTNNSPSDLVLAGFLFGNRTLPIFEGVNRLQGDSFNLEKDALVLPSNSQEYGSNEWVDIGNEKYFVKILSKKYRLKGTHNA